MLHVPALFVLLVLALQPLVMHPGRHAHGIHDTCQGRHHFLRLSQIPLDDLRVSDYRTSLHHLTVHLLQSPSVALNRERSPWERLFSFPGRPDLRQLLPMLRDQLLHILFLRLQLRRHLLVPDPLPLQAPQAINDLLLAADNLPDGSGVKVLPHIITGNVETGNLDRGDRHGAASWLSGKGGGTDDVPGGDGTQGLRRGAWWRVPGTCAQRWAGSNHAFFGRLLRQGDQAGVQDDELVPGHGLSFTAQNLLSMMGGLSEHPNMRQQPRGCLHLQGWKQLLQSPH
mmetsp:Transcript_43797/g.98470  ORF Transcript_43797/g.98470 Transcript_43797/m.98470 type:complete len:284 (+) Transcript_43797:293-1144(+)